jgi:hypothetical protein
MSHLYHSPRDPRAVPHTLPFESIHGPEEEGDCALDGPADTSSHHANHGHKASKVHDNNAKRR